MLALRTFMFERVYLGPHTEAQHERAREVVARVRASRRPSGPGAGDSGRPRAADRRLRCRYDGSLRSRLRGPAVVPRFTEDSKQRVIAAADMVDVVSGVRSYGRSAPATTGRCPFHEDRTPSFSVNAVDKLYYCFGCGAGGDLIKFVRETEQLDFAGAVEWLAERFRVQLEYEEMSPQLEGVAKASRPAPRCPRPGGCVLRAASVGDGGGGSVRGYLESRGSGGGLPRVPARALARHGPRAESAAEGLHVGRAPRGRPDKRAGQRPSPAG